MNSTVAEARVAILYELTGRQRRYVKAIWQVPDLLVHAHQHQSQVRPHATEIAAGLGAGKGFKSVPGVVDVSSFGGLTREYQVQVDPNKLVDYGLTIGQVEQALAANNTNAGGSFIEQGSQEINVRAIGLMTSTDDIGATVLKTTNGTPVRVRDVAMVTQGLKIRLGQIGKAIHPEVGRVIDSDDVVEGIVLLRKGEKADATLRAIHDKVKDLNEHVLPAGVKIVPRSDLLHYTTHTVLRNLTEGLLLVSIILFVFLGTERGALIVAFTIPFSLYSDVKSRC